MQLSSPIIDGDLGRSSGRFPESSSPVTERGPRLSPHDCIVPALDFEYLGPQLPADGNFKAEVENGSPVTLLSSTMKEGGLGKISAAISAYYDRIMLCKARPDCIIEYSGPQPPADGNFKVEVENGSPFTDFDRINLPEPPPGLFSKAKHEEALEKNGDLPNIIRGPNGQEAYIVYSPPDIYKCKDDAGRKYPKAPPNYETVLRDRKGVFFHPYCKRYPCLVAWHCIQLKAGVEEIVLFQCRKDVPRP
jgi:hypothetical protein